MSRVKLGRRYYDEAQWKYAESLFWQLHSNTYVPERFFRQETRRIYRWLDGLFTKVKATGASSLQKPDRPYYKITCMVVDGTLVPCVEWVSQAA